MAPNRDEPPPGSQSTTTGDLTAGEANVVANHIDTVHVGDRKDDPGTPGHNVNPITQPTTVWTTASNLIALAIFLVTSWNCLKGLEGATPEIAKATLSSYSIGLGASVLAFLPALVSNLLQGPWSDSFRQIILSTPEHVGMTSLCAFGLVAAFLILWALASDDYGKRIVASGIKVMCGAAAGAALQHRLQVAARRGKK